MAEKTSIEWTRGDDGTPGSSWNPIRGTLGSWHCVHASTGCLNCYSERMNIRWGGPKYRVGADTVRLDEKALKLPQRWKRPRRVFVCSMTDLFGEWVPDEWIERIFDSMLDSDHTYMVLTKRAERMQQWVTRYLASSLTDNVLESIWLGVSVENQAAADERIPHLLATPAAIRWISAEPLIGPVMLRKEWLLSHQSNPSLQRKLNWVVAGAESGTGARPCDDDWFRLLRDACAMAATPYFLKQRAINGHKIPLPELDGRQWVEWPETKVGQLGLAL